VFADWVSFSALLAIQFGFAALLGALVDGARHFADRMLLGISGLLYVGASLALPIELSFRIIAWLVSALLFWGFLKTPFVFSSHPRSTWLYVVFAMTLIAIWSAAQTTQVAFWGLGAAAGLAAGLACWRGLRAAA